MSNHTIQKIIDETVFTMWVEGYAVSDEERDILQKVLLGDIPFSVQLERYIQNAKMAGATYAR